MAIERHILGPRYGFPVIPVERNRCTMAQANACALPGKLEKVADVLHLKHQKDAVGGRLMKAMSKPRKALKGEDPRGVYWVDDDESRVRLEGYCATDVEATRELFHTIPRLSEAEQRLWVLDQKINGLGFHLDAKLARAAHCVVTAAFPAIDVELDKLTGGAVTAACHVARLKTWLQRNGVDVGERLTKGTVEELLGRDLPPAARRAIELRALGAQAAVKKVHALLNRREADGRIRGSFIFHAAGTGRFSSRGAGIHNLKRPETAAEDLEHAIKVIGRGNYQLACQKFANPLSVIGDLIRSMICAAPGCVFMGADFSGIEARVTAWLAGEVSKLEVFRNYDAGLGPDPYLVAAGRIYNKDPTTIDPKSFERVVGKASELALGFMAGIGALKKFLPADSPFDDRELERIVRAWRRAHPNTERLWNDIGSCARKAVRNPGEVWTCHGIEMMCDDAPFLWVTLPSGRRLAYPHARIAKTLPVKGCVIEHERGRPSLLFKDNAQGQWRDVRAWPGLLVENLVQAVARDLLAEAMTRLDAAGFKIISHTHDSVVVEVKKPTDEFLMLMIEPPRGGRSAHCGKNVDWKTKPMNQLFTGRAAQVMRQKLADASVDAVITSPPYFTAVGEGPWDSYETYLADMQSVWVEISRVLKPGGLFCLNTMLMPLPHPKKNKPPVRTILPLPFDHDCRIRSGTDLRFFDMIIWQKQTSHMMLGAYPFPGNNLINNTTEMVVVYRKPGRSRKVPKEVKEASVRFPYKCPAAMQEHSDLAQQVWTIYPEKVKRDDHPAPFPELLVRRLLRFYTFIGDTVLDPFCGSGTVPAVAKQMSRQWVGIDIEPRFVAMSQARVDAVEVDGIKDIEVRTGRPAWPKPEPMASTTPSSPGDRAKAERKHKQPTYGTKGRNRNAEAITS